MIDPTKLSRYWMNAFESVPQSRRAKPAFVLWRETGEQLLLLNRDRRILFCCLEIIKRLLEEKYASSEQLSMSGTDHQIYIQACDALRRVEPEHELTP